MTDWFGRVYQEVRFVPARFEMLACMLNLGLDRWVCSSVCRWYMRVGDGVVTED